MESPARAEFTFGSDVLLRHRIAWGRRWSKGVLRYRPRTQTLCFFATATAKRHTHAWSMHLFRLSELSGPKGTGKKLYLFRLALRVDGSRFVTFAVSSNDVREQWIKVLEDGDLKPVEVAPKRTDINENYQALLDVTPLTANERLPLSVLEAQEAASGAAAVECSARVEQNAAASLTVRDFATYASAMARAFVDGVLVGRPQNSAMRGNEFGIRLHMVNLGKDNPASVCAVRDDIVALRALLAAGARSVRAPLLCEFTYLGFRILCYSGPRATDPDVQQYAVHEDPDLCAELAEIARVLNLSDESLGCPQSTEADARANTKPSDTSQLLQFVKDTVSDRVYLLNPRAMLPPLVPEVHTFLVNLKLRPELVSAWGAGERLVSLPSAEARGLSARATHYLLTDVLDECVAAMDGLDFIPVDSTSLARFFHRAGLNLRLLGIAAQRAKMPHVRDILVCEMVARCCKTICDGVLRGIVRDFSHRVPAPAAAAAAPVNLSESERFRALECGVVDFFNLVLGEGLESELFWKARIAPLVLKKFGFQLLGASKQGPLGVPVPVRGALYLALQHHCRVEFSDTVNPQWGRANPISESLLVRLYARSEVPQRCDGSCFVGDETWKLLLSQGRADEAVLNVKELLKLQALSADEKSVEHALDRAELFAHLAEACLGAADVEGALKAVNLAMQTGMRNHPRKISSYVVHMKALLSSKTERDLRANEAARVFYVCRSLVVSCLGKYHPMLIALHESYASSLTDSLFPEHAAVAAGEREVGEEEEDVGDGDMGVPSNAVLIGVGKILNLHEQALKHAQLSLGRKHLVTAQVHLHLGKALLLCERRKIPLAMTADPAAAAVKHFEEALVVLNALNEEEEAGDSHDEEVSRALAALVDALRLVGSTQRANDFAQSLLSLREKLSNRRHEPGPQAVPQAAAASASTSGCGAVAGDKALEMASVRSPQRAVPRGRVRRRRQQRRRGGGGGGGSGKGKSGEDGATAVAAVLLDDEEEEEEEDAFCALISAHRAVAELHAAHGAFEKAMREWSEVTELLKGRSKRLALMNADTSLRKEVVNATFDAVREVLKLGFARLEASETALMELVKTAWNGPAPGPGEQSETQRVVQVVGDLVGANEKVRKYFTKAVTRCRTNPSVADVRTLSCLWRIAVDDDLRESLRVTATSRSSDSSPVGSATQSVAAAAAAGSSASGVSL